LIVQELINSRQPENDKESRFSERLFSIDSHLIGPYNRPRFAATFTGLQESAMLQAKFSCKEDQIVFLNSYRDYGFKDKSSMIREALNLLRKERDQQTLQQSAALYAETYEEDSELRELTATATHGWPE